MEGVQVNEYNVLFQPDNKTVAVVAGTDLLTAARLADAGLKCGCGGEGTCGKCLVRVVSGRTEEGGPPARDGLSVACRTRVAGDLVVEIPAASRLDGQQVLVGATAAGCAAAGRPAFPFEPLVRKVSLSLTPPSLVDATGDAGRLASAFKRATGLDASLELPELRALPAAARTGGWNIDVTYEPKNGAAGIIAVEPAGAAKGLWGLAVDVGTTTVAVYLVDLTTGRIAGRAGSHNRQAAYGDDVITRIIHAAEADETAGLVQLQQAVVATINELAVGLAAKSRLTAGDIRAVVVAGNTTMTHLLLALPPANIRLEPYVPAASHFPSVRAGELGLAVHPRAIVHCLPAVASYVGGDIVAGAVVNGMAEEEPLTLFLDIGTNGEMVLGNRDWLVSCACSAGPAFEGAGVTHGMRASPGAIAGLAIDKETYEVTYRTVDGLPPQGLCGSGLIDALAKLRQAGVIDRAGQLQDLPTPRMRRGQSGREFVLAWAEKAAGSDIVLTEADIKNLLRAKAAVYAGVRSLLKLVELDLSAIERVYIAGGFGSYLNIADAVNIGLLPDLPAAEYVFLGNASVQGAHAALTSAAALAAAEELADKMTYIELSAGNLFMEEFISALFLPHTDLSLFPSVGDESKQTLEETTWQSR
jgi:uncharacterized 2Fe-2S/4Fe-4S cluster protein (DUF4445 family)